MIRSRPLHRPGTKHIQDAYMALEYRRIVEINTMIWTLRLLRTPTRPDTSAISRINLLTSVNLGR